MSQRKTIKPKIILAVCGGIAAYKTPDLVSGFRKAGYTVEVIQTPASEHFVTPNALAVMADRYWSMNWGRPDHIDICAEMTSQDALVIAPATANTIGKIAHGIADNLVTDTIIAMPRCVNGIVCPAMNSNMITNPIVAGNIEIMKQNGWNIIPPGEGLLACGTVGIGKLPPTRHIVNSVTEIIMSQSKR
jgi:phosphopantothenoylcysteine synthetase/decarboxylase